MTKIALLQEYNTWLRETADGNEAIPVSELDTRLLSFLAEDEQRCEKNDDDTRIEKLGLSIRAENVLKRANIKTVGALERMTERELMNLRNMGRHSLEEIADALVRHKNGKQTDCSRLL